MIGNALLGFVIRTRFRLTDREKAGKQAVAELDRYLYLADQITPDQGKMPVRVPPMPGIQRDMRDWSFYMLLEHNSIVNRSITSIVENLARGEEPSGHGAIDPKKDVMPSQSPGEEQVAIFQSTVNEYLDKVSKISVLKRTREKPHPIFGKFDAHCWHCMFAFHLRVHTKQAAYIVKHFN